MPRPVRRVCRGSQAYGGAQTHGQGALRVPRAMGGPQVHEEGALGDA